MKITQVNIPEEKAKELGLHEIQMKKLGQVVVVAGENGSGKTRLLNLIESLFSERPTDIRLAEFRQFVNKAPAELNELKNRIITIENSVKALNTGESYDRLSSELDSMRRKYNGQREDVKRAKEILLWNYINTDVTGNTYQIVKYVPKQIKIHDLRRMNMEDIESKSASAITPGTDKAHEYTFARIQDIQNKYINTSHHESDIDISDEIKKRCKAEYEKLKEYIDIFLGAELKRSTTGEATLFGFRLGDANLSEGQKVLLQLCVSLHSQESVALENTILFMDEPESHLHPAALLEVIKKIKAAVPHGQIWIATHSLSILSHFDPSCIWYMDDGRIKHAGKIPEQVLGTLLGGEENREKLHEFLSLPAMYASNQFAAECLFPPMAVSTGPDDPQTNQIKEIIIKHAGKDKIRVLDFGAGKGRLLTSLLADENIESSTIPDWLDYYAYDLNDTNKEECNLLIQSIYDGDKTRYFNEISKLRENCDDESFDIIVMCNVLHEIDPNNWIELFNSNGVVYKLLKHKGYLLIVEDQLIPNGEKAHTKGFLVLNTHQLKKLFAISEGDTDAYSCQDARGDGRLKAHLIKRNVLVRISFETKCDAISSLRDTAKEEITQLRSSAPSSTNGRLHGFWTQQFANAVLALDEAGK